MTTGARAAPARATPPRRRRAPVVRPPPSLREPIRPAARSVLDRAPPLAVLAGALLLSAAAHLVGVGAARGARRAHEDLRPPRPFRVALIEKPAPPVAEPAPALPEVVKVIRPRKRLALTATPPPPAPAAPSPLPPPPSPAAPLGTTAPVLMPGFALSATTGSMAVTAGTGVPGTRAGTAAPAGEGLPSKAKEIAPPYALTEEPIFLDNVSPEKVRSFYPEDARKAKLEAVVRAKLVVDDDGSVARVVIVSDPGHGFGAAATKVARLYRFKPARINGRPVATEITFTIRFELE